MFHCQCVEHRSKLAQFLEELLEEIPEALLEEFQKELLQDYPEETPAIYR